MKILWFSPNPCGSLKRKQKKMVIQGWMISLESELKKQPDIELEVAYFSDEDEAPFEFEGVKYYPMYRGQSSNPVKRVLDRYKSKIKSDQSDLKKLTQVVRASDPDIIHVHGTEDSLGLVNSIGSDIPVVFSIQGLLGPIAEKYFSGLLYRDIKKYESLSAKLRRVSIKPAFDMIKYRAKREMGYLKSAKYILGRTFWDRNVCGLFNPDMQYFTVGEILRPQFYECTWNKNQFGDTFRIVSTLSPSAPFKGYETLLKAANLLKMYADFDWEWYVVGYNDSHRWAKIAGQVTKIDYRKCNIRLMGVKNADELSTILTEADLYCQVSHMENSSNSLGEAMIKGIPIVATYAGGTASMLANDQEGLLIQDGDSYVMAGTIVRMHADFKAAQEMGRKARQTALKRHDKAHIVDQLLSAYKTILGSEKQN